MAGHVVEDGYAMTESERRSVLAKLVAVAIDYQAGVLDRETAQALSGEIMRRFKRRLRRRIRGQLRRRGWDVPDGV